MFISKVTDEKGGDVDPPGADDAHEYATANELFDIMTKNQNLSKEASTLSPGDLVLLYKNIDLGTQLSASTIHELKRRQPNQHVETIIYNDDRESNSEDSDVYSTDGIKNLFVLNKERMDIFNSHSSFEHTLCHKLGDLEIQSSDNDFDKHFLFKDPYIKEQLKNFNFPASNMNLEGQGQVLPASLLDYICCKRLEDNYNFYMDNIIIYVKSTIEQLKRISNGDYLTNRARAKWREVENVEDASLSNAKVLATSTSIPLHIERKSSGSKSTWDDLVHSSVDVRSLSKILEKKIVFEIPKLISGSYILLSKLCDDNLIISCQDSKPVDDKKESRVDVVLKLNRSKTGHVVSNISSIMILQTTPTARDDATKIAPLPLTYTENDQFAIDSSSNTNSDGKITEVDNVSVESLEIQDFVDDLKGVQEDSLYGNCGASTYKDYDESIEGSQMDQFDTVSNQARHSDCGDVANVKEAEQAQLSNEINAFNVRPDDLRVTMQRLTLQSSVPEEVSEEPTGIVKKRSGLKVRIKSPYENKSQALEEKKRKKLIEIRQRRENKKMAMAEKCKITKNKYGKAVAMPQTSNSVTKLSITNKSFYNSIFGHSGNGGSKQGKLKNRKDIEGSDVPEIDLDGPKVENEIKGKKKGFVDRSYYLDEADTEMMYTQLNEDKSGSTSAASVLRRNLNLLSQLLPSDSECNYRSDDTEERASPERTYDQSKVPVEIKNDLPNQCSGDNTCVKTTDVVANNSPSVPSKRDGDNTEAKEITTPLECRRSIDKLYQLVTNLGKQAAIGCKNPLQDLSAHRSCGTPMRIASHTSYTTDSRGNLLNARLSPKQSLYSLDKIIKPDLPVILASNPMNVTPKVIISSRPQPSEPKIDVVIKKDRKRLAHSVPKVPDQNPLKAISQLLHNIETVQKHRIKIGSEKCLKKPDAAHGDGKIANRVTLSPKKRHDDYTDKRPRTSPKDSRSKANTGMDVVKIPYQQVPTDAYTAKTSKKKIADIIDEAKEARGEAVKGPPKFTSRLNTLAQPKKSYVQAHSEEYMTKYGRNLITDRLQRLATAPPVSVLDRIAVNKGLKPRRPSSPEAVKVLHSPTGHPLDRIVKPRLTRSISPDTKKHINRLTFKQNLTLVKPENIKKKLITVEAYMNCHYVPTSTSSTLTTEFPVLQKTRATSALLREEAEREESFREPRASSPHFDSSSSVTRLMYSDDKALPSHALEVVDECQENSSRNNSDYSCHVDNLLPFDVGHTETTSYSNEVPSLSPTSLDDGIVMEDEIEIINTEEKECDTGEQFTKEVTTLERAISPLCRALPLGTFCKHMQCKKRRLKLSPAPPTPSVASLFVVQSGDSGSFIVKATLSQNFQSEGLLDLNMPVMSATRDWGFVGIPMQITTVNYAFSEQNVHLEASPFNQLLQEVSKNSLDKSCIQSSLGISSMKCDHSVSTQPMLHKDTSVQQQPNFEQGIQVNSQNIYLPITNCSDKMTKTQPQDLISSFEGSQGFPYNDKGSETIDDFSSGKCIYPRLFSNKKDLTTETDRIHNFGLNLCCKDKNASDTKSINSDRVDYTTSLDILVGILNEIKKITTCQTRIARSDNQDNFELEMLLNNTDLLDISTSGTPLDTISITSLDKHRCLESNQSLYSFYLSEDSRERHRKINKKADIYGWYESTRSRKIKPVYIDREIDVSCEKEYVHTETDVPSLPPLTLNHSTKMSNAAIVCRTTESFTSVTNVSVYSNASSTEFQDLDAFDKKIIEIPNVKPEENYKKAIVCYHKPKQINNVLLKETTCCVTDTIIKKNVNKLKGKYCLKRTDCDPVMKMKRDILVTIYSMLVLTVFAALSFPEVMYYV